MRLRDASSMPSVGGVMTPFPYFVVLGDSVADARAIMDEHRLRHLPVKQGDEVVGLLSRRDLDRWVHPAAPASDLKRIHVERIMTAYPYCVPWETPLAEVLEKMAETKIGTAVVTKGGRLAGILTLTDVCTLMAELLRDRFPESEPPAA